MDNSSRRSAALDQLAVLLSGLCLLHCLLLPFAMVLLPFLGQFSEDHLHAELLIVVIPVSAAALATGYRKHGLGEVVAWGLGGLLLLIIGGTVAHNVYGLIADRVLTVVGSLILAVTHYRNFRLTASCSASQQSQ
jgi:hypothetical protein